MLNKIVEQAIKFRAIANSSLPIEQKEMLLLDNDVTDPIDEFYELYEFIGVDEIYNQYEKPEENVENILTKMIKSVDKYFEEWDNILKSLNKED